MDAFLDAVAWHYEAFLKTGCGDIYRVWFGSDGQPMMQRLIGDETEYIEPLAELRKRDTHKRSA